MLHALRVDPGTPARIAERETDDRLGIDKDEGEKRLEHLVPKIDELQYRLYGEDRRSILLVLQGLDASGKDGVVRRVFDGVNPTAVRVTPSRCPRGRRPSTTTCGASMPRCPPTVRSACSTARTTRTS